MYDKVQTKARSYDDVLNCWSHWTIKWMDFVSDCPDLLQTRWFFECESLGEAFPAISEMTAIEMRKLISTWVMLYGSDVVRIILSVVDFETAKKCRLDLLADHEIDENMSMSGWLSILNHVHHQATVRFPGSNSFDRLLELMSYIKPTFFETALSVFKRKKGLPT